MKRNLIILAAVMLSPLAVCAGTKQATICTTYGDHIYDYELDQMIDSVVPPSAKRLIVLTQCYGGNCLGSLTGTNTAVVSATSAGQTAVYGGYDDDAANACKPGTGKTGQSAHAAGTGGKHSSETPSTGGGLAAGAVSLEPVTSDGAVRSRHVIVYAGIPDKKGRDHAQRDKIKANFAGETNTTVTTVGGKGPVDGWDKHGWKRGLQSAINEAAAAIEAAPDPSKEQFLLFVTDHGDLHNVEYVTTPVPPSNSVVVADATAFFTANFQEQAFERPGFSITVNIAPRLHVVNDPTDYTPFFADDAWRIRLTPPPPATPILLTEFEERFIEWEDGIIGNAPAEGLRLFFPVDPLLFVDSFFDITYDVEILNQTADVFEIMTFSQDTGPVAKGDMDGEFIHIVENTLIGENDMALDGCKIVVDGCTLTLDGIHVLDRLTLANNAVMTHSTGSIGTILTVLNGVTVPSGSKIDVSAKGYGEREGTTGSSGGSYGGLGEAYLGASCPTYGWWRHPLERGSGGGGQIDTSRGGGYVSIKANSLELDGAMRVNGQDGPQFTGGGSGGAIFIEVALLSGAGLLQANGGAAGAEGGAGGGGRVAIYADSLEGFTPTAVEAKASGAAQWGTVFMGVPRMVAVARAGQGICDPMGPVLVPYGGIEPFVFEPSPISIITNGTAVTPDWMFAWNNTGLWRGTLDDTAWLDRLNAPDTLAVEFEPLAAGEVMLLPGAGMMLIVNGLAGWRYTLERRESLTQGAWIPLPGQTDIICDESGELLLIDEAFLPQAFYRVIAQAP